MSWVSQDGMQAGARAPSLASVSHVAAGLATACLSCPYPEQLRVCSFLPSRRGCCPQPAPGRAERRLGVLGCAWQRPRMGASAVPPGGAWGRTPGKCKTGSRTRAPSGCPDLGCPGAPLHLSWTSSLVPSRAEARYPGATKGQRPGLGSCPSVAWAGQCPAHGSCPSCPECRPPARGAEGLALHLPHCAREERALGTWVLPSSCPRLPWSPSLGHSEPRSLAVPWPLTNPPLPTVRGWQARAGGPSH